MGENNDEVHTRWLASSIVCCIPSARKGSDEVREGIERPMTICHDQPHLIPPPKIERYDARTSTPVSWHTPQFIAGSRQLASRASSRASLTRTIRRTITTESLRPTIGAPSGFRKFDDYKRRSEGFRPLELSIYLPENKLSPLPIFSDTFEEEPAGLEYPARALTRCRSSTLLSQSTSNFRIPRKPVGSISDKSTVRLRPSVDRLSSASSFDMDWGVPPRPNLPDSSSTQELLTALEARLPKAPPPLRIRSKTEPLHLPQRRDILLNRRVSSASDRGDDRQEIDRRLNEFDTIVEERPIDFKEDLPKSPTPPAVPSKSPIIEVPGDRVDDWGITLSRRVPVRSATFSDIRSVFHRPLPPTPLTFNQPNPLQRPPKPPPPPKPQSYLPFQTEYCRPSQPADPFPPAKPTSTRDRVSQWLFPLSRNADYQSSPEPVLSHGNFYQCITEGSTKVPSMSSTVSTRSTSLDPKTPPSITPQSSPGRSTKPKMKPCVHILAELDHPLPACPPNEDISILSSGLSGRSPVGVAF
ncbi:MAG: hypothetical protein M1812_007799 [Candelaria pacifica]|nr:MAG: hypothetical protein M1812_007799 [Candelaria pacifica]